MPERDWEQHYASAEPLPWDTGHPDPHLVELVEQRVIAPGRTLEIGCGSGTNAIWLASRGFDVFGIDVAPSAIAKAEAKRRAAGARVQFSALDFLHDELPAGPFDFVFDRGVLHVFDSADDRARFAERVASALRPGGQWLCLAGSTEGPPRDDGPPRRSARDLLAAVEPALELVSLRSIAFDGDLPSRAMAWLMLSRAREAPAQPSTAQA
ncbi:MAG TPA: class I SAM-dependent methyltransferase [Polyangiaceae bacterium]|nr:class I SAM-dependent methyltransferase [Polyangiaceae bacterium]